MANYLDVQSLLRQSLQDISKLPKNSKVTSFITNIKQLKKCLQDIIHQSDTMVVVASNKQFVELGKPYFTLKLKKTLVVFHLKPSGPQYRFDLIDETLWCNDAPIKLTEEYKTFIVSLREALTAIPLACNVYELLDDGSKRKIEF
jgi:hypothetical protein